MKRILLGVGNRLSGDDGIGPSVARRLQGSCDWLAIDCGSAPENVTGLVAREKPDLVVIIDAARMGLEPGSIRRLPLGETDRMLVSTHGLPLAFLFERLQELTKRLVFIGVEPKDLAFGEGLSPPVGTAVDELLPLLVSGGIDRIPRFEKESGDNASRRAEQ